MTPQQQGRFCDSCRKCVVDFTGFTDAQLYEFIAEHKGQKICGRFQKTQLNRQINIPPQPNSQLYKWMIAAGLALVFVAAPEMRGFTKVPFSSEQLKPITDNKSAKEVSSVQGTVLGPDNEAVTRANISLYLGDKEVDSITTDSDGNYIIRNIPSGRYNMIVIKDNYRKKITQGVIIGSDKAIEVNFKLSVGGIDSPAEICEYKIPHTHKFGHTTIVTGEVLPETLQNINVPEPHIKQERGLKRLWHKIF